MIIINIGHKKKTWSKKELHSVGPAPEDVWGHMGCGGAPRSNSLSVYKQ